MERAAKTSKILPPPTPARAPTRPGPAVTPAAQLQSRVGAGGMQKIAAGLHAHGLRPVRPTHHADAPRGDHGQGAAAGQAIPKKTRVPTEGEGKLRTPAPVEAVGPDGGGGGGGDKAAEGSVKLHIPEPPTTPSKATQARIAGVKARAGGTATAQAALPDAASQVGDAKKAVTPPTAEQLAEARAQLIAQVHAAPSPAIVKLCERIRQVIRDRRPPDEDALEEADPTKEANEAGAELNATVQNEGRKVEDNYQSLNTPATPAPAPPAPGLKPQPPATPTAPLNAKAGTPDAVPAGNVSLDKDAEDARKRADAAGMNKPAAALVQSGPVAETREAQGELDNLAKADPAKVLAQQKEALASANADMGALQMRALAALTSERAGTAGQATEQKKGMVASESQMREQAGVDAKAAFDDAQGLVKDLLKDLVPNAMTKWDTAKTVLTTQFKADLKVVQDRVDERHSGFGGTLNAIGDYVTGLPDWATDGYDKAETNFADGVIAKLTEISTEVDAIIKACEALIKKARDRIAEIYNALPLSLKEWAASEQAKFDGQLDKLGQEVHATQESFNTDLGQRASQAVDEVRAEIAALRKKAGGLVGRIVDAVGRFLDDPVKFIIEGLLELVGISPPAFWAVVAKIKKVVRDIVDDPMGFANNLMAGLGQGFSQFFDNFGTHMIRGFLSWLLGDLKGVQVPKDFSLKSIVTFFLQIMGITWPNIRKIIAKKVGEKNVALIEKIWSLVSVFLDKGVEGIFEMIEQALDPQALVDQVIQMAVDYMVTAIAKQVAVRLALLFNPAGAILQAIEAIYRVLKWVFQNAARIFTLIETIVNGVADIIAGNVGGFANAVEKGLEMLIAPVLGFIADYFSLGDLPKIVAKQIKGFQAWILGKIEAGFDWVIAKGKALLAALGIGGKKDKEKDKDDPDGIKATAEAMLLQTLGESATPEEVEAAIPGVFTELQPKGLKALTMRQSDDGYEIDAEASPRTALFKLLNKKRYSVRFAARVHVEGEAPAHAGTTRRTGVYNRTVETGRGKQKTKPTFGVAILDRPHNEEAYVGRLVLDPTNEPLDERRTATVPGELKAVTFVTGNTGDSKHRSNSSHAEEQFLAWMRAQPSAWLRRVKIVEISITLSPCGKRHQSCVNGLMELMSKSHLPNVDVAASSLHWDSAWVDPGGETTTTAADVANLATAFGQVGGPIDEGGGKLPIEQ